MINEKNIYKISGCYMFVSVFLNIFYNNDFVNK